MKTREIVRVPKQPIVKNTHNDTDFRKFLVRVPKQPVVKNTRSKLVY